MMLKQQLTQEDVVTLSMVYDAETTTHAKVVTLSMVYDAETTTQSCYTDHNSRTLS
jgi:metal-sulfur cluster biosynthetic enzyme